MAESGYDLDDNLDSDDFPKPWEYDDGQEEEVDTTRPFRPGAASTPYQGREQYEMQTMMHEQGGLPDTSYEETPLLGELIPEEEKEGTIDRARDFIKKRFQKVDFGKLGPIGFSKKGDGGDIVSFGRRGGEAKIF